MNEAEIEHLAKIQAAMKSPNMSLHPARSFTHGVGIQVYVMNLKVGPIIFPNEGETVADVLHLLGTMMVDDDG